MEHYSLKQLSLYPLTTQFTLKAINFTSGEINEIKVFKDTVVYFEYATKYLKYLQHLNTQGFNVLFLPALVLGGCVDFFLDDISKNGIQILYSDGLKPLYYLETSPSNFQVILRFNTSIPDNAEYLAINRYLVEKYNADPGSIGIKHFFRLAGFTNRKEKYLDKNTGYFPFVRLTVGGAVLDKSSLPPVAIAPVARPQKQGRRGGRRKLRSLRKGDLFIRRRKRYIEIRLQSRKGRFKKGIYRKRNSGGYPSIFSKS